MTLKEAESFVEAVLAQQRLNREAYDNTEADDQRKPIEWGVIAGEHMGHLLGALHRGDEQAIEKEILHVAGPLLECWNAVKTSVPDYHIYKCTRCESTFRLVNGNDPKLCPLCEAKLEKIHYDYEDIDNLGLDSDEDFDNYSKKRDGSLEAV